MYKASTLDPKIVGFNPATISSVAKSVTTPIFLKSYDWIYQHSLFFGHSRFRSARVLNSMCKQYKKKRFRPIGISVGIVILPNRKFPYRESYQSLLDEIQVS